MSIRVHSWFSPSPIPNASLRVIPEQIPMRRRIHQRQLPGSVHAGGHINRKMVAERKARAAAERELDAAGERSTLSSEEEIDKISNIKEVKEYLKRLAKVSEASARKAQRAKKWALQSATAGGGAP